MNAIRFTKDVIEKVLERNEGVNFQTNYKNRNFSETNSYRIHDGKLFRSSSGNTSWADSKFNHPEEECDYKTTQRILRENQRRFDLNI